jgi:hypothetical protein
MEALKAPQAADLEGQYRWRDEAIDAIALYCLVEEARTISQRSSVSINRLRKSPCPDPLSKSILHAAVMSVFVKDEKERPQRCFVCIGLAFSLQLDDPHIEEVLYTGRTKQETINRSLDE